MQSNEKPNAHNIGNALRQVQLESVAAVAPSAGASAGGDCGTLDDD
jgi:hypothetical protein